MPSLLTGEKLIAPFLGYQDALWQSKSVICGGLDAMLRLGFGLPHAARVHAVDPETCIYHCHVVGSACCLDTVALRSVMLSDVSENLFAWCV